MLKLQDMEFDSGLLILGRLEKLLKQENYRKQNTDFTDICRDLLQYLLMTKPDDPLKSIHEYFKQMKQDRISQ